MTKRCPTCEYSSETEALVFESNYWRVFLHGDQSYLGRCLVDLKRHAGSIPELTSEEWIDLHHIIGKLENALTRAFHPTLFNWTCLMNHAFREKPYNPHVHWHLKSRYEKTVSFAGHEFQDKEFGNHYDRTTNRKLPAETMEKIIQEIKKNR